MKEQDLNQYAYLDQLSTRELQELLRADADSPESGDDGAISYILEVMKKRERKDPSQDPSSDLDRCWTEFQTLYNTPEGADGSLYPTDEQAARPAVRRQSRRVRRIVLAAAALVLLAASLTVPVAGYNSILEMLGIWATEQFTMRPASEGPGGPIENFEGTQVFADNMGDELRAVLKEHGITEDVVPHQMPQDFKLQGEVLIQELAGPNATQFFAIYSDGKDYLTMTIVNHLDHGESRIYEKTGDEPEQYSAGDITCYIFQSSDNLKLMSAAWYNDTLECVLNTTLPESDLKQIIDSIYEE